MGRRGRRLPDLGATDDEEPVRRAASPLYSTYAKRLKDHNGNHAWLRTLPDRAEVVEMYEGDDAARAWLEALRPHIVPPDDGVIDLLVGRSLRATGNPAAARTHLLRAAEMSLCGIEWYCLEALSQMSLCLVQLGEHRLAFEYARVHHIQSFMAGRIDENDLYRAVFFNSVVFGQIGYLIEVKRNLARKACEKGDFSRASQEESDVALRLAIIGVRGEATAGMYRAANHAARGSHPNDPYFAVTCRLLGRYLDEAPLGDDELERLWAEATQVVRTPPVTAVLTQMGERVRDHAGPGAMLLQEWLSLCEGYEQRESYLPGDDLELPSSLLICNHLAALLARYYYTDRGDDSTARRLIDVVASRVSLEVLFDLVREDYANRLIQEGDPLRALEICRRALAPEQGVDQRFAFARLAARSCLALGRDQEAFAYAQRALSDWRRVLEGLFVEEHKASWLARGASVIATAMEILGDPRPWMSEPERYREMFRITELGKARLTADMVSHPGYVSGVYLLSESYEKRDDLFNRLEPGWFVPFSIQVVPMAANDGNCFMMRSVDSDSGRPLDVAEVDTAPLRSVIQLPMSPERSLYATAQSLPFDEQAEPPRSDLYDDLVRLAAQQAGHS